MAEPLTQQTPYGFDKTLVTSSDPLAQEAQSIDLAALAAEDVARQRGEMEGPSPEQIRTNFDTIMSATTQDEIDQLGVSRIGNFFVTPNTLAGVKGTTEEISLFNEYKKSQIVPEQDKFRLAVGFSGPKYEEIRLPQIIKDLPQDQQEIAIDAIRNRQAVAKIFDEVDSTVPFRGQQIILNSFSTGDIVDETAKSFRNIPGDFARMPTFGAMIVNATTALKAAALRGDDKNGMDYGFKETFSKEFGSSMQAWAEFIKPYEDGLNKTTLLDSATTQFNKWYKEQFISSYDDRETGMKAWRDAHQVEKLIAVQPGDEGFDPNRDNGTAYVDYARDENGEIIFEDVGLSEQVVGTLVETAYQELAPSEKAVLFGVTQVPFTLGLTALSVAKGARQMRLVSEARKQKNKDGELKYGIEMDDWEVWKSIKKENSNFVSRNLQRGFVALTLGAAYMGKGTLERGRKMNTHLETLTRYDSQISDQKNIINDAASTPQDISAAKRELAVLQDGFTRYKVQSGGSTGRFKYFNNPYTRALGADDVIIAGAVGYTPEILSWEKIGLDTDTAQIITMLTTPILAPAAFRGSLMAGGKIANLATSGALTDIAKTLENATYIPFVSPAMLVRGDEAEVRAAMEAAGVAVTDKALQSYVTMSKIYKELRPEYQVRVNDSLKKYNRTMTSIEKRMRTIKNPATGENAFSDEEIAQNMSTLHLSLAHATGLAPLISIQAKSGGNLSARDLKDAGKMEDVLGALAAEEENYRAMDTLLRTLNASILEKSGVQLDSNEPLQQMLVQLGQTVAKGRTNVNLKKQEMLKLVESYYSELGEIDENTLQRILNIKTILSPEEITGPVEQAQFIADTAVDILEGGREQARVLSAIQSQLSESEVLVNAENIADQMFDITYGTRKATVSAAYRNANDYIPEGASSPITIDMSNMAERLMDLTKDYNGKPLSYMFSGGKEFFTGRGKDAKNAFETAAARGLRNEFGGDELGILMETYKAKNATDLALKLMDDAAPESRGQLNYFQASFEEAEDIRRAFQNHHANAKGFNTAELDASFADEVDEAYRAADPSGKFMELVQIARNKHSTLVGEATDTGRYAGDVISGTERLNPEVRLDIESRRFVPKERARAIAPFRNIAILAEKIVNEADGVKRQDLLDQVEKEKIELMRYFGEIITDADGNQLGFGFNLNDRKQRVIADKMESLFETLITKRIATSYGTTVDAFTDVQRLITRGNEAAIKTIAVQRMRESADYDFGRVGRLAELEKILVVPVMDSSGTSTRKLALAQVKTFSKNIDELLLTDSQTRRTWTRMRDEINSNTSVLRIAAQAEVDEMNIILRDMENYEQLVNKPTAFFDTVFENATLESIDNLIIKFTDQGMSEADVRAGLKYMYLKGIDAKTGRKKSNPAGTEDVIDVIKDATVLIDMTKDSAKAAVMKKVLGQEHFEEMQDIADWASFAIGDGLGFRADPDIRQMSVDSAFSRVFNLARGMVSPIYVATEVSTRAMMLQRQTLIQLALSDRVAARIIGRMLSSPKAISREDIKVLGTRINNYIATGVIRSKGEVPAVDAIFGSDDATKTQEELAEEETARQYAKEQEMLRQIQSGEII